MKHIVSFASNRVHQLEAAVLTKKDTACLSLPELPQSAGHLSKHHCISVGHYDAYAAVFNTCDARCVSFLAISAKTILHIGWTQ